MVQHQLRGVGPVFGNHAQAVLHERFPVAGLKTRYAAERREELWKLLMEYGTLPVIMRYTVIPRAQMSTDLPQDPRQASGDM
ncbi:hypothetical protein DIPPA_34434 [Diplonema papillatum]|nr:hypothetical protein DIPPA_34434 [Diplonema papillatum]